MTSKPTGIDHSQTTTHDFIEISDRSSETVTIRKIDKSTYTDFLDQALCENTTQTKFKEEQDTQTTNLNCPYDSQVYLCSMTSTETQCDSPAIALEQQKRNETPPDRYPSPYLDISINPNLDEQTRLDLFRSLIHVEEHPNGGAFLIRSYYNEFLRLSSENAQLFVKYFFNLVYGEMNQRAKYSIGVLHDGARYLPDLVDYFSLTYPKMVVKTSNLLNSKEVLTTNMGEYRNRILQSYSHGTYRYGPLMSISLVGTVPGKEECGMSWTL